MASAEQAGKFREGSAVVARRGIGGGANEKRMIVSETLTQAACL